MAAPGATAVYVMDDQSQSQPRDTVGSNENKPVAVCDGEEIGPGLSSQSANNLNGF